MTKENAGEKKQTKQKTPIWHKLAWSLSAVQTRFYKMTRHTKATTVEGQREHRYEQSPITWLPLFGQANTTSSTTVTTLRLSFGVI